MPIPDPKWLEVLKLPLKASIAAAVAMGALLLLVEMGVLDLAPFGVFALPLLIICTVVFAAIAVVGTVHFLFAPLRERQRRSALATRRAIRQREDDERRAQARTAVLGRLDSLSREEVSKVASALRDGSPTFYTYVHSPAVSAMQGKGLVWTPGGMHNQDNYPFSFYDYVWEALLERKDEFLAKDDEHRRAAEAKARRQRHTRDY